MRAEPGEERGAVAVIVAIMLVAMMAAVALTVDVGGLFLRRRELVTGSDSAALSAARTCARGGSDSRFGSPEEAADAGARLNGRITADEVSGTDISEITLCGTQWGHASVEYTSQQSLEFAPVLGFSHESPVTTAATASWGLGSNNPMPVVLDALVTPCEVNAPTLPSKGQTCAFWYDNDRLGGGNFSFLSLNYEGWDVPAASKCPGAQSGGSSSLRGWITGKLPASVSLNWVNPTYVCTETGIKGVSNASLECGNPNNPSTPWRALQCLADIGAIRDFPLNWRGPGAPPYTDPITGHVAPPQGTVMTGSPGNPTVDKYDIIGFAAMKIMDVVTPKDAADAATTALEPWPTTNYSYTSNDITLNAALPGGSTVAYVWTGQTAQGEPSGGTCAFTTTANRAANTYEWSAFGDGSVQCPGAGVTLDAGQPSSVDIQTLVTSYGPCGEPPPGNSSAMCVVLEWQSSTLDEGYQPGSDNNTVVRLCDLAYGTCLDQRRGLV
jgi:hypothetical protein